MKKITLLLFMITALSTRAQFQQPQWEMPFFFEDADGVKDTIWIGYDPEATTTGMYDSEFENYQWIDTSRFNAVIFYGLPSPITGKYVLDSANKIAVTSNKLELAIGIDFIKGKLPLKITWPDSLLNSDSLPFPDISPRHRAKVWIENDFGIADPDPPISCGFHSYLVITGDASYVLDDFECLLGDSLILTTPDNDFYTAESGIGDISINIVPLNKPTGVGITEMLTKELNCFPNPFNEHLFLQKETAGELELILYNSLSQQVISSMMPHNTTQLEWSTSHLPAGVYLLQVRNEDLFSFQKLIKSI